MHDTDIAILCTRRAKLGPLGGSDDTTPLGDRVVVQVAICPVAADRLAAHRRERGELDPLAAESREVATPVLDALVAAGYGRR